MKIEDTSQFLQVNAVAQRVRQLIVGAAPRLKTGSRRPTAIALAELHAGKLEVYDPQEAVDLLADDGDGLSEEERAANEAARALLLEMFPDPDGEAPASDGEIAVPEEPNSDS